MRSRSSISKIIAAMACLLMPSVMANAQDAVASAGTALQDKIDTAKKLMDTLIEFCVKYSFQVLGGIIVILLGFLAARIISRLFGEFLKSHNVDVTISKFLVSIVKMLVIAFAFLIALGSFGITIAPFIAGLSVIGFGASFAVQGPLSNYAAGITLIFTKPFKVGDIVEVSSVAGTVMDMTLARTELRTIDGTTIYIPNKNIIGEVIHNFTEFKKLDLTIGVSYDTDMGKAINIIKEVVRGDDRIAAQPEPKVGISEFADSSVNIYCRLWCKPGVYWDVMFDVNRKVFDAFANNGITIPFPQRDVHIIGGTGEKIA
ncbi:MAG: mechanosensitive ion channel [Candidatus Omnitrophica bacterium]|nr:mechanosensitive ion channel [Candidatus Omnitrophota bacterium]MDD5487818.1 mechanosensitive ion channel [Candidatus Omnitrophota bacterium]